MKIHLQRAAEKHQPETRVAILSHDPSVIGEGALLGDRATMINSQDDRVFMRSMATRGRAGGLSPATEICLALLARSGFVRANRSAVFTVDGLTPGTYSFWCEVADHTQRGMVGTLTIDP